MDKLEIHNYPLAVSVLMFQIAQALGRMKVLSGWIDGIRISCRENMTEEKITVKRAEVEILGLSCQLKVPTKAFHFGKEGPGGVFCKGFPELRWNIIDFQLILNERVVTGDVEWCPSFPGRIFSYKGTPTTEFEGQFVEIANRMFPGILVT